MEGVAGAGLSVAAGATLVRAGEGAATAADGPRSAEFTRAAGCVGYDIVRATDAADHFVVIESWPSKGARLAHTLETDGYEEYVYSDATVDAVFRGPSRLA